MMLERGGRESEPGKTGTNWMARFGKLERNCTDETAGGTEKQIRTKR